jgi:folate-dependent phosphoribosylglycinamide formyltransferase PurN
LRVTFVSRYPRVDTVAWKRRLGERLLELGIELGVVYSRAGTRDQLRAGLDEYGAGIVRRYLSLRARPSSGAGGGDAPQSLRAWALERGLAVAEHQRLGDPDCLAAVRAQRPDLLVLTGADIVPKSLLEIPALGTINPHYGLLPRYRGMNVTEWSIWHDDPVGVTVHMVGAGIDTGATLLRECVRVERGDGLPDIRAKQQELSARLLYDAAVELRGHSATPIPQREQDGRQYYRMHPALLARVERQLASGAYSWIGEDATPDAIAPILPADAYARLASSG